MRCAAAFDRARGCGAKRVRYPQLRARRERTRARRAPWLQKSLGRSRWLRLRIHHAIVEKIRVRIVVVDLHYFRNEAPARPPFNVNNDVERIADIGLDGAVGQLYPAL